MPNCHKIKQWGHNVYQIVIKISIVSTQRASKMYHIWGFGLKIDHLATLVENGEQ
jgi:hypothetical protein